MRHVNVLCLSLLVLSRVGAAQTIPGWANVAEQGASIRIPVAWLAVPQQSIVWALAWSDPNTSGVLWAVKVRGIHVELPASSEALQERLAHAATRFFWFAQCGDPECVALTPGEGIRVELEHELLLITLEPGPALTKLRSDKPDSLRVAGMAGHPVNAWGGWLRVTYAR